MRKSIYFLIGVFLLSSSCSDEIAFNGFSYPEGKFKSLIMSYDDGTIEDIQVASLFNENKIVGTFNLNSQYIGATRGWPQNNGDTIFQSYIPRDSLLTIYQNHEIAAHGAFHKDFIKISKLEILEEINTDISILTQLTNREIKSMAYPFGNTNDSISAIIKTTGLTNARTVADTYGFSLPDNYFAWNPTCHDSKALEYLNDYIVLEETELSLMYVWGHSWEFKDEKRWNDFIHFCESIGNRDDIWYVGSGDFVDYQNAIKSVRFSDKEIINPINNDTVWMNTVSGIKILAPGETLRIKQP